MRRARSPQIAQAFGVPVRVFCSRAVGSDVVIVVSPERQLAPGVFQAVEHLFAPSED